MRTKDFDEKEILRKAITLFWEKGYYATSLHDLIDALEIGRSSIYHTFGDKHNLFVQAIELYQQEATAKIKSALENGESVKIVVKTVLQSIIDDVFSKCPKGCFKVNSEVEVASHDEMIRKLILDDNLVIETAFYQAILRGQLKGEINKSKKAEALARFICNTITGMRVYAKMRNDRQFFEDIVETTMSTLD